MNETPVRQMTLVRKFVAVAGVVALLSAPVACGDDATSSLVQGNVFLTVAPSQSAAVGAVRVRVTGPGVSAVAPASSSYTVYWRLISPSEVQLIVLGAIGTAPVVSLTVSDSRSPGRYTATVLEAAGSDDQLITDLAQFSARIETGG